MARGLRIQFPGAFYHIITRGNEKRPIFIDDSDRKKYLEIIGNYKRDFGFYLYCYTLMTNHNHLLIETPMGNISRIMLCVNTNYAVYFNRRHNRVGHLFQGRYKSIVVDKEAYLLRLLRYIHLNPVRAKMVRSPKEYKWSSHRVYISGKDTSGLIDTEPVLGRFGNTKEMQITAYRDFVESEIGSEHPGFEVKEGQFLGDDDFINNVKKNRIRDITENKEILQRSMTFDEILSGVARFYKTEESEIRYSRGHKSVLLRYITIWFARKWTNMTLKDIGECFGGMPHSGVFFGIKRVEREMCTNKEFAKNIQRLAKVLTKLKG